MLLICNPMGSEYVELLSFSPDATLTTYGEIFSLRIFVPEFTPTFLYLSKYAEISFEQ